MNKPAVTQAQIKRAVKAVEAMGKTVAEVLLMNDGTARIVLTGGRSAALPSDPLDAELAEWDRKHGYG